MRAQRDKSVFLGIDWSLADRFEIISKLTQRAEVKCCIGDYASARQDFDRAILIIGEVQKTAADA